MLWSARAFSYTYSFGDGKYNTIQYRNFYSNSYRNSNQHSYEYRNSNSN